MQRASNVARIRSRARTALLLAVIVASIAPVARADHEVPVAPDLFPRITTILSPLFGAPAIEEAGTSLRVEVDPARATPFSPITARLTPSFGAARHAVVLSLIDTEIGVTSRLWPGRAVNVMNFALPAFGPTFVEDLYDLTVRIGDTVDTQHRSVKVIDAFPSAPTFAIIADPSVGDPRPIQEGAEYARDNGGDTGPLLDKTMKTIGDPMHEERWAALIKAIDEINLVQPDFVLISGDLTFAIYPRAANVEYEDAYRILSRLRVPTFLNPGNHDLYNFDYDDLDRPHTTDGWELWQQYFGPLYYSTDIGPDLHVVSVNTYDWPASEREPFDEGNEFSTRSGGQIQAEQFDWLEADLMAARTANPTGAIVTFAHHDPSWIQARHPWAGINRLESRDLFADEGVGAHFSGHTHEDRVARYHLGNIVETNGRRTLPDEPHGDLHYVLRDNQLEAGWSQSALGDILREPSHGPLFVSTTTVSSVLKGSDWGQGSYWGWRYGVLDHSGGGYDPADFGYPVTRELLDEIAERPERWKVSQAAYGVFSYPSYRLSATADGPNDGTSSSVTVTVQSDLLVDMDLLVPVSVAGSSASATGGTIERSRTTTGITDAFVRVAVPAGATRTLTVSGS